MEILRELKKKNVSSHVIWYRVSRVSEQVLLPGNLCSVYGVCARMVSAAEYEKVTMLALRHCVRKNKGSN